MTRNRWVWVSITCAVAVVVALVVGAVVYFSTGHRAARMADRIGVSVPNNATDLQVDDPPFALQGNCSAMAFLIPKDEWRAYVQALTGAEVAADGQLTETQAQAVIDEFGADQ